MSEKKKESLLKTLWKRGEEAIDATKMKLAFAGLRNNADKFLTTTEGDFIEAKADMEEAIIESRESKDFEKIVKASLKVKTSEVKLKEAVAIYKEYFGEEPRLISESEVEF